MFKGNLNIRQFTAKLEHAIKKMQGNVQIQRKIETKKRTMPWWTFELTTMRKRKNSLRRRFQRTTNNENLRECRKRLYEKRRQTTKLQ